MMVAEPCFGYFNTTKIRDLVSQSNQIRQGRYHCKLTPLKPELEDIWDNTWITSRFYGLYRLVL